MRQSRDVVYGQKGFTLIELIVIIVILGILAAVAVPKFADYASDARKASLQGMSGAVRGASQLVHAASLVAGNAGNATGTVTVQGTTVNIVYGYPASADIDNALETYEGFTLTAGNGTTAAEFAIRTDCKVTYVEPTAANTPPVIGKVETGC